VFILGKVVVQLRENHMRVYEFLTDLIVCRDWYDGKVCLIEMKFAILSSFWQLIKLCVYVAIFSFVVSHRSLSGEHQQLM